MAMSLTRSSASVAGVSARSARVAAVRPAAKTALRAPSSRAAPAPSRGAVVSQALPVEIAVVAGEAAFITGTALTMVAMTLTGLAIGFVLLRVEALVEEGKL